MTVTDADIDLSPEFLDFYGSMINMDAPRHVRLRRIVSQAFTPRMMSRIENDVAVVARRIISDLAEGPAGAGAEFDFVSEALRHQPCARGLTSDPDQKAGWLEDFEALAPVAVEAPRSQPAPWLWRCRAAPLPRGSPRSAGITVLYRELLWRLPAIQVTGEPVRLMSSFVNGIKHLPAALVD